MRKMRRARRYLLPITRRARPTLIPSDERTSRTIASLTPRRTGSLKKQEELTRRLTIARNSSFLLFIIESKKFFFNRT